MIRLCGGGSGSACGDTGSLNWVGWDGMGWGDEVGWEGMGWVALYTQ